MLLSQKEFDAHNRVANRGGAPMCQCPDCNDFRTYEEEMAEADVALQSVCVHDWQAAVDEDGQLVEPPYDICGSCGDTRS